MAIQQSLCLPVLANVQGVQADLAEQMQMVNACHPRLIKPLSCFVALMIPGFLSAIPEGGLHRDPGILDCRKQRSNRQPSWMLLARRPAKPPKPLTMCGSSGTMLSLPPLTTSLPTLTVSSRCSPNSLARPDRCIWLEGTSHISMAFASNTTSPLFPQGALHIFV